MAPSSFSAFVARRSPRFTRRAFTLIELMVVIGVIAVLVGGVSYALRGPGSSGLLSAQNTLGSMVSYARSQAAVNQTEARLVFYNTRGQAWPDRDKYLRVCQVFVASPAGSTTFVPTGSPTTLPTGTYLVPPVIGTLYAPLQGAQPWQAVAVSTMGTGTIGTGAQSAIPAQPAGTPFNTTTSVLYVQFNSDGTVWTTTTAPTTLPIVKLVVTTGGLSSTIANSPAFDNPSAVRGIVIRPSGALNYVSELTGF